MDNQYNQCLSQTGGKFAVLWKKERHSVNVNKSPGRFELMICGS